MPNRRPRLVVLDTSHIAGLAADWMSRESARQQEANSFVRRLMEHGWLPLLSWPQLEELIQHENDEVVDARLQFLWSWPLAACIRPSDPDAGPGKVLEILTAEALAAHANPNADALAVRDLVRRGLVAYGPGTAVIPSGFEFWRLFRQVLAEKQARARELMAIAPWKGFEALDKQRMGHLMSQPSRSPQESLRVLNHLSASLAKEVKERGDKRIPDPKAVADEFFAGLMRTAQAAAAGGAVPTAIGILQAEGVDIDDIHPDDTFGEVMDRHTFKKRLRIAIESRGLSFEPLRRTLTLDRLPVAVIQHSMRRYGHDQPERKGSDMNDVFLLCLAPYADLTFVDKRTLESVRRARSKVPVLEPLLGDVRKASGHCEISSVIAAM
ncbi:MAG: hypothetical protein JF607_27550 [Burkholderiales bacterium]|nr:hypothetical protein [Burkholderiales bacterium]